MFCVSHCFSINKDTNTIKIGDKFKFIAKTDNNNPLDKTTYNSDIYLANKGYSIIRTNHLTLGGKVEDKPIDGSAYFQRVFVYGKAGGCFRICCEFILLYV